MSEPTTTPKVQWWLAKLDRYGNPSLCDGAHSGRAGAERAMYLYDRLGLRKGEQYGICRVEVFPAVAAPHGANEDAIAVLNSIGLTP
jgi:hypothetical protein